MNSTISKRPSPRHRERRLAVLLTLLLAGCGGHPYRSASVPSGQGYAAASYGGEESGSYADAEASVGGADSGDSERTATTETATGGMSTRREQARVAAVAPQVSRPDAASEATDAVDTTGELLIYNAGVSMAVYEVRDTQARLIARVRAARGFVSQQTDHQLVLRIPAAHFRSFMDALGEEGRVLDRNIAAQDVGEEFRDIEIRIRNLEVTRQRIEALLAQAATVADALAVQRELERITGELEALRGRQRYLADRVAFSTITINFQPLPREALAEDEIFQLPFRWLHQLGLGNLLEMR